MTEHSLAKTGQTKKAPIIMREKENGRDSAKY